MKVLAKKIDDFVGIALVSIVFTMLGMSVLNVILRWFGISYSWIEPMVRHLVFFTAFLGATLACGKSKHIGIEILKKFLETKKNLNSLYYLGKVVNLLTLVSLVFLTSSGYSLFKVEQRFGSESFLSIHSSFLVMIIPFGFGLMFLRTLVDFVDFSKEKSGETK